MDATGFLLVRGCALLALVLAAAPSLPAAEFPVQAVITSDSVRIRSQPSLRGSILGRADHGMAVTALGRSRTAEAVTRGGEHNWWYQVETPDHKKGWVYGEYVYLETQDESAEKLQFKMTVDGKETTFTARVFSSRPPDHPGQTRSVLAVSDPDGALRLLHLPANLVAVVRSYRSNDQWYTMLSDRSAVQALQGVSVMAEKNLVQFEISERSGGSEAYRITLTSSYNTTQRFFQVEFSETVPQ
jgi:hypothetical protein